MSLKMRFTSILVALALLSALAFGQTETGQIVGTVTDPQSAVVPGAKVTVKNTATGAERSTTTAGNTGLYGFTNLQPGQYEVTVEAANFATTKKRVDLTVGARSVVDFRLTIGTATVVEVVEQSSTSVELTTQELSQVVTEKQVLELPTITRNAYSLVGISGNVSGNDPTGRGVGVAINGQRAASTGILLDGGENVDLFVAAVGQSTPLDSVGEFRVITSNFSAEYGRASGGIVNVATKGGSNSLHGTVYEFYRGAGLTANTYENNANGVAKPNFVRNQFGYSIGGPVVKDKLFFFNSTEWIRVRSSANLTALVPDPTFITSGAVNANTSTFFNAFPLRSGLTVLENDQVVGGIPWDRVQYSVPSNAGGGSPVNEYQTVARVDFNWTDKTQLYGRYALQSQNFFPGTVSDSAYAGFDTGATTFNNNILISLTRIWTPNVVSQSKVVYNRLNSLQPINGDPTPTLFMRSRPTPLVLPSGTLDFVALPGYLPFSPGSGIPFGGPQNLYQFYQDVSWSLGKHQFRFGGQYIHTRDNRVFGAYQEASEILGNTTAQALTNLVNGQLLAFQGAINPQGAFPCPTDQFGTPIVTPQCQVTLPVGPPAFGRNNRYNDWAFYGQDSWKIHPRFTLNLGLRWEYYGVQHNADPSLDSNFYLGTGANFFEQLRNGQVLLATDPANPVGGLWAPDRNNFAPRVGFAWDLFGDGKTSLRGGYGISYERNFGNVTFNVIQNPPNYAVIALTSGVDAACTPSCPITLSNFGPLGSGVGTVNLPKTSLRAPQQDLKTAYAHFWSLSIERQLAKNTVLALEYSGSRGVGLYSLENPNRVGSGPLYMGDNPADQLAFGVFPSRRINDQYTGFNRRGANSFSDYNALNVRVQSNNFMNTGWSFVSNYTWAHSLDNLSSTFSESSNNFNLGLLDPYNPALDKGNADFDIRHRWILSGTWDVPWFKKHENWFVKNLIGGWTLAPIISAQTGNPFTLWDCTNAVFEVCPRWMPITPISTGARENVPGSGPNTFSYITINPANSLYYFNPVTLTSEFGNCGVGAGATTGCPFPAEMTSRNAFRAPGVWNVDLGIYKNISLTERFRLQFRGELFNAFNHSNLYVIGSSADFTEGGVTAKRGGSGGAFDERRNIQLALKLIF